MFRSLPCLLLTLLPLRGTGEPTPPALVASPGNVIYYVNPAGGNDAQSGTSRNQPWKSLAKVNSLRLAPGDKVLIAPGTHDASLMPSGKGTAGKPVVIRFLPGRHEFVAESAHRGTWFVSNSCDAPTLPRPVGILLDHLTHFKIAGGSKSGPGKSDVIFSGRMTEIINDHCEHISFSG